MYYHESGIGKPFLLVMCLAFFPAIRYKSKISDLKGQYIEDLNFNSRRNQPGCDLFRIRSHVRALDRKTPRWVDEPLSSDHDRNQRDRILFSIPRHNTGDHLRHYLARAARGGGYRQVCSSPRGWLALDLRGHCHVSALLKRLRFDRAVVPESAGAKSISTHAIGSTICSGAAIDAGALLYLDDLCGD